MRKRLRISWEPIAPTKFGKGLEMKKIFYFFILGIFAIPATAQAQQNGKDYQIVFKHLKKTEEVSTVESNPSIKITCDKNFVVHNVYAATDDESWWPLALVDNFQTLPLIDNTSTDFLRGVIISKGSVNLNGETEFGYSGADLVSGLENISPPMLPGGAVLHFSGESYGGSDNLVKVWTEAMVETSNGATCTLEILERPID